MIERSAVRLDRRRWLAGAAALLLAACGRKAPRLQRIAAGATVLAHGDSLTFGSGAAANESYPAVLTQITGWNVVNAGVPGNTSAQARERLPALLELHAPQLVLLSIGGNDFLRQVPEDDTRAAIIEMLAQVRATGAATVLIAVPRPSVAGALLRALSDHSLFAEVAETLQVPLLAEAWSEILSQPALKSDQIHANAAGYAQFAQRLQEFSRDRGLLA